MLSTYYFVLSHSMSIAGQNHVISGLSSRLVSRENPNARTTAKGSASNLDVDARLHNEANTINSMTTILGELNTRRDLLKVNWLVSEHLGTSQSRHCSMNVSTSL